MSELNAQPLEIKIFESVQTLVAREGGRARVAQLSTQPLENQINDWVRQTGHHIRQVGPVHMQYHRHPMDPSQPGGESGEVQHVETRTIAVTYLPAPQQENEEPDDPE